ncbi:hypothetical protein ScPMuIL_017351 [Solemya velum]
MTESGRIMCFLCLVLYIDPPIVLCHQQEGVRIRTAEGSYTHVHGMPAVVSAGDSVDGCRVYSVDRPSPGDPPVDKVGIEKVVGAWRQEHHENISLPDYLQFVLRNEGNLTSFPLKKNSRIDINAPLCTMIGGRINCTRGAEEDVAFYQGQDTFASLSLSFNKNSSSTNKSGEIEGVFVSEDGSYEIQPKSVLKTMLNKNKRRIVKRSFRKRFTGEFAQFRRYPLIRLVQPEKISRPRSTGSKFNYTVDVLVIVDYSIYKKFLEKDNWDEKKTMSKLRYYFAHVINGMELRFSTINDTEFGISIRLGGFYVGKNESDLPFIITFKIPGPSGRSKVDGKLTLLGLTDFLKTADGLPTYDHAMLFTEYDATNAYGHILEGVHGAYTSAGIAAHELGHNLGVVFHDGERGASRCPSELNYIMAPSSAIINNNTKEYSFLFSDCSVEQIKKQMKKMTNMKTNCLEKQKGSLPAAGIEPYLSIKPGQIDNVHEQCRQIYGNTSFMCPPSTPDELCYKMYCYHPGKKLCVVQSEQKGAFGTTCGDKKWCMLGKCVEDKDAPEAPDDCPYPDLPPPRGSCTDASPLNCQDRVFYKRCCKSCNKNFTEEEACKDTKIRINGHPCSEFIKLFGSAPCTYDSNIPKFCCASCKASTGKIKPPKPTKAKCEDNKMVRINELPCPEFVAKYGARACKRPMPKRYCCKSCTKLDA